MILASIRFLKTLVTVLCTLYTLTRAFQGWYMMMTDVKEYVQEKRAAKQTEQS